MTCQYPNCHKEAMWTPAIEVPTLRSVGMGQAMVKTPQPTILVGKEICQQHRESYVLLDWMSAGDWTAMQDLAHENGLYLSDIDLITVRFYPIGWTPSLSHLELTDRNRN